MTMPPATGNGSAPAINGAVPAWLPDEQTLTRNGRRAVPRAGPSGPMPDGRGRRGATAGTPANGVPANGRPLSGRRPGRCLAAGTRRAWAGRAGCLVVLRRRISHRSAPRSRPTTPIARPPHAVPAVHGVNGPRALALPAGPGGPDVRRTGRAGRVPARACRRMRLGPAGSTSVRVPGYTPAVRRRPVSGTRAARSIRGRPSPRSARAVLFVDLRTRGARCRRLPLDPHPASMCHAGARDFPILSRAVSGRPLIWLDTRGPRRLPVISGRPLTRSDGSGNPAAPPAHRRPDGESVVTPALVPRSRSTK